MIRLTICSVSDRINTLWWLASVALVAVHGIEGDVVQEVATSK